MKKTLLVTVLFLSQYAFAVSPVATEKLAARMTLFKIGHQSLQGTNVGDVTIDIDKAQIVLDLYVTPVCDPAALCAQVLPDPITIEVPLVNVEKTTCGVKFTAEVDNTIADGLYEKIEVVDYSMSACLFVRPMDTTISYESFNPWTQIREFSTFEAQTLKPLPDFF